MLMSFYVDCGVTGMTILGLMGEAPKLRDTERAGARRVSLATCASWRGPVPSGRRRRA